MSEVGAVVTIEDEATVGALRALRLTSGEYLQLEFAGGELRSTHARLVGDPEYGPTGRATLDTEFIHLRPVTEIVEGRALSEALTTITLRSDDTDDNAQLVTVDVVGRRVYYLLEALELSRALVNEVLLRQAVTSGTLAEPPRLASLRMSSPLELVASIANSIPPVPAYGWSLYAVLLGTADRASDIIQKTANAKKTRAESEVLKQEARRLELGNDALEDRNLTSHLIQEHIRHSLTAGGVILGERTGPTMRFINLDKRFEEVILKLVEQEVRHLETGPDEAA